MTYRATMTPVEVDTFLAENWGKQERLRATIRGYEPYLGEFYRGRPVREWDRERAETAIAEARGTLDELRAEAAPYEARYATDQWDRYFLVTNGNGHVHRGMDCTTCYPTTQYAWLIELADCDEAAMVADCGEKACTVCFPDAPSEYARLKAAGLLTRTERLTADERAAVAAEKAAKAAAKAAKAITNPDGTELRLTGRWGDTIRTEVTARRELTGAIKMLMVYDEDTRGRPLTDAQRETVARYTADRELLLDAITAKTGEDRDELLAKATDGARKALRREGY